MSYHFTTIRLKWKRQKASIGKDVEKLEPLILLVEM